jgi:hypothetical protein
MVALSYHFLVLHSYFGDCPCRLVIISEVQLCVSAAAAALEASGSSAPERTRGCPNDPVNSVDRVFGNWGRAMRYPADLVVSR